MKNNKKKNSPEPVDHSRRNLLRNAGLLGAAAAASAASAQPITIPASGSVQPASAAVPNADSIPVREALENLTALETETLDSIIDRIMPADEHGPGAREARAIHYIDRALASHHARYRENYATGLQALHEYAMKTHAAAFSAIDVEQQDAILLDLEASRLDGFPAAFFSTVRRHTLEGTFSDPYYGGNHHFIGWDLLRYPGVRLGTSTNETAQGAALAATHQSAYDHETFTKSSNKNHQVR